MKSRSLSVAVVCGVTVAVLSGCAGEPHPTATGASAAATYSADDLVDILDRTGTALGVEGQLITDAQLKDAAGELGDGSRLIEALGLGDVSYIPEACGTLLRDALAGGVPKDAIASQFRAGTTTITAASFADKALTASQTSAWTTTAEDALQKCAKVTMSFELSGTRVTAAVTTKKVSARSTADKTSGLEQTMLFTTGDTNTSVVSRVVLAVSGNLLISATSTRTDQTTDVQAQAPVVSPEDAVDAVITVAAQGWHR